MSTACTCCSCAIFSLFSLPFLPFFLFSLLCSLAFSLPAPLCRRTEQHLARFFLSLGSRPSFLQQRRGRRAAARELRTALTFDFLRFSLLAAPLLVSSSAFFPSLAPRRPRGEAGARGLRAEMPQTREPFPFLFAIPRDSALLGPALSVSSSQDRETRALSALPCISCFSPLFLRL
ncbi:putative transmembrane protein [Toxoplasma gondii MAS]|uniref:Putative transmembrane protein n=1 Tax=Toxoplasma gondii MAS TaxID=943118 RepID=A0A086QWZ5_TOXGO|nr:putative transmembrane protein [Toxoplasma gondii MAS]